MRFTDRSISALKAKSSRYEEWEDGRTGLGIRVAPSGRKSWVFMYRFGGKPRRMTLGTYPLITLADAHMTHAQAKKKLERGTDPGTEAIIQKREERQAETVRELVDEFMEKYSQPRKRSAHEDRRCLEKEIVPLWGHRKAKSITRRDAITMLDRIVDRGSPIMANRTLAIARRMFSFGVDRDILEINPLLGIRPPAKEVQRDRVLTEEEIRSFWQGLDKAVMPELIRLALRFLLATIQRRSEVVEATWSEFDLTNRVWVIGSERAKNGVAHSVPLSPLACQLLDQTQAQTEKETDWVFPSPRLDDRPFSRASINHYLTPNLQTIGLKNLRPHDLRRTGASQMTGMGIPRLVVSKILNHADREITGVYDRHTYDAEKRHALDAWGTRLEEIVSGQPGRSNVLTLTRDGEVA